VTGPLDGLRVVTLPAIGPVPHAAMLLADLGAEVVPVTRPLDAERVGKLAAGADVLLEGFRPGVAERRGSAGYP
jgi:alpha-methylacyl-CoA racemase